MSQVILAEFSSSLDIWDLLNVNSRIPFAETVLNRLVQFNVIRRYVKTNSIYTTHRLNALAAPPGIRV